MNTEEVVKLRTALKAGKDVPLSVVGDNVMLFNEKFDFIVWDDANAVAYVFRSNPAHATNKQLPYEITAFDYDIIQYLKVAVDEDICRAIADGLGDLMTQAQKDRIISVYKMDESKLIK